MWLDTAAVTLPTEVVGTWVDVIWLGVNASAVGESWERKEDGPALRKTSPSALSCRQHRYEEGNRNHLPSFGVTANGSIVRMNTCGNRVFEFWLCSSCSIAGLIVDLLRRMGSQDSGRSVMCRHLVRRRRAGVWHVACRVCWSHNEVNAWKVVSEQSHTATYRSCKHRRGKPGFDGKGDFVAQSTIREIWSIEADGERHTDVSSVWPAWCFNLAPVEYRWLWAPLTRKSRQETRHEVEYEMEDEEWEVRGIPLTSTRLDELTAELSNAFVLGEDIRVWVCHSYGLKGWRDAFKVGRRQTSPQLT